MKVNSTIYKGIEFIEISSLPIEQKTGLLKSVSPELLIKILVDGKMVPRCIQYRDYEEWYDNSYKPASGRKEATVDAIPESRGAEVKADLQI